MSSRLRRYAAISGLALAASVLSVPLAAPARAAAPADRMWKVSDPDGDGRDGLYRADSGGSWTKVEDATNIDIFGLSSSGDGTRIVYVRVTIGSADAKQELVVRDTSTRVVRVLETRMASTRRYIGSPALSPNGTRAVWEVYDDAKKLSYTFRVLVGAGNPGGLATGYSPYTFLDNDVVLVQDAAGRTYVRRYGGGSPISAPGIPGNAFGVRMSPDGTKLAWGLLTNSARPYTARLEVAPFTFTSNDMVLTVGTPIVLDTTDYNRSPSWSRDGSTIFYLRHSGAAGAFADIYSTAADGSMPPTLLQATSANEVDVDVTSLPGADTTAPGAVGALPVELETPILRAFWTPPSDADLSGVILKRWSGSTVVKQFYVPAPLTSYADNVLVDGADYIYTFTAVDRSGNLQTDPIATRNVRAVQALPTFADPTSATTAGLPFAVTFVKSPQFESGTTYVVDYQVPGESFWHSWVTNQPGATRVFGSPDSTGVAATTSTAGMSVAFRVVVTDIYGNRSLAVRARSSAVVPFDQTKAAFSGGTTVADSRSWLGTYRKIWSTSHSAKVTLYGNRLSIIGVRCPGCGIFGLYDGSILVAKIDTNSTSWHYRVVLTTRVYSRNSSHTYTIRPMGTTGRPYVLLDGFAMRS